MSLTVILALIIGLIVCNSTYYAIHRHQQVPVLASAITTLIAIVLAKALPEAWQLDQEIWHLLWFGSSFCGMNNNRWVGQRSVSLVWVVYAAVFWLCQHLQPWPGGSLGTLAVLSAVMWILMLKTHQGIKKVQRKRGESTKN